MTKTAQTCTPLVRQLAAQRGVNLARVTPTGVGGRITPADVMSAAAALSAPLKTPTMAAQLADVRDSALYRSWLAMTGEA